MRDYTRFSPCVEVSHTNLTAAPNCFPQKKIQVVVKKFNDPSDCPPSKEPTFLTYAQGRSYIGARGVN